jgi:hypothetical protein
MFRKVRDRTMKREERSRSLYVSTVTNWCATVLRLRRAGLGVCPNIRDHELRREFDSIKAGKRSRTLHQHSGNDEQ